MCHGLLTTFRVKSVYRLKNKLEAVRVFSSAGAASCQALERHSSGNVTMNEKRDIYTPQFNCGMGHFFRWVGRGESSLVNCNREWIISWEKTRSWSLRLALIIDTIPALPLIYKGGLIFCFRTNQVLADNPKSHINHSSGRAKSLRYGFKIKNIGLV